MDNVILPPQYTYSREELVYLNPYNPAADRALALRDAERVAPSFDPKRVYTVEMADEALEEMILIRGKEFLPQFTGPVALWQVGDIIVDVAGRVGQIMRVVPGVMPGRYVITATDIIAGAGVTFGINSMYIERGTKAVLISLIGKIRIEAESKVRKISQYITP